MHCGNPIPKQLAGSSSGSSKRSRRAPLREVFYAVFSASESGTLLSSQADGRSNVSVRPKSNVQLNGTPMPLSDSAKNEALISCAFPAQLFCAFGHGFLGRLSALPAERHELVDPQGRVGRDSF